MSSWVRSVITEAGADEAAAKVAKAARWLVTVWVLPCRRRGPANELRPIPQACMTTPMLTAGR